MRWTTRCAVLSVLVGGLLSVAFAEVRLVVVEGAARVRLRSEPRIHPSTVLGSVPAGALFPFQEETDGWIQVGMADGSSVWISGRYVRTLSAPGAAWVRMALAPLFAEPGPEAGEVRRLEAGRLVIVDEVRGDWVRVRDAGELAGWMRRETLELLPESSSPEEGPVSPPADESSEGGPGSAGELETAGETEHAESGTQGAGTVAPGPAETPTERPAPVAREEAAGEEPTPAAEPMASVTEGEVRESGAASREPGAPAIGGEEEAAAPAGPGAPERTWYYLIAALIVAGTGLLWWWRRRRLRDVQRFLRPGGAGERVRPAEVRRRLAELRERRENLQRAVSDKFQELKELATSELSPEGSGALSRRLSELGRVAELYERRNETLSDLLALQSEMIDLLREENDVLRRAGGE